MANRGQGRRTLSTYFWYDFGVGGGEDLFHRLGEVGDGVGLIAFGSGFGALFDGPAGHAE